MHDLSRRTLLGSLTTVGGVALGGLSAPPLRAQGQLEDAACGEQAVPPAPGAPSLADLAARQERRFGCAVKDPLFTDEPFQRLVAAECKILVCVYSMKWRHVEPQPGQFDFRRSDLYVDFAEQHGMAFRGHTLVWDKELPDWIADELAAQGFGALERHIQGVAAHYTGRLQSWDVVNEAVWPEDGRADRLRNTVFLQTLGSSYIAAAFEIARAADPHALLYYNANPAPYGRAHDRPHFEGVIALLEQLRSRDVPVQGVGLQGHLAAALDDRFDETTLAWFLQRASELGLEIAITELDVTDKGLPADVAERDRRVARTYRRFLDIALAFPAVKSVLTWGLSDRYTGLNRWPRRDGWAVRGLPYDHCLQPKLARQAVAEAFMAQSPG